MSRRSAFLRCSVVLAAALVSLSAQAHRPWLMPSSTMLDGPAPVLTVDGALTEDLFEYDAFPLAIDTLIVLAPDGSIVAPDVRADARRRTTFDVKLPQPGTYRISGVTDTTMASYKLDGETKRWRGATAVFAQQMPANAQDVQATRMLGRVETFVTVDEPGPLAPGLNGQGLELVPLTSPTDLSTGDTSRFRLLLDGKPIAQADVTVIRGGNRYRYKMGEIALKTDAAGEFAVTWPEAGRYWLGAAHGGRPDGAHGPAPARRESYSATFEVLPK